MRSLTAHLPAFCCQANERLLAASSDEVVRLIQAGAGWDRFAADSGFYNLSALEGACRASCCAASCVCVCCCCCCCCNTVLTAPLRQLRIADLAVGVPGTDAARYSSWMQPGLDWIALQALMMQCLALLEQPVPLGLALRSVGAEVSARVL